MRNKGFIYSLLFIFIFCCLLSSCQYAQRINPVKLIYPEEGESSVAAIKKKLHSDDAEVRALAAQQLIEKGDRKSFKTLTRAFKQDREDVIVSILKALTFKSDERFVEPLIEVLKTKSERLHPLIFQIVHSLGSETLVSILLGHLEVKEQPLNVRKNLIRALGHTKQKVAVQPLLDLYPDPPGKEVFPHKENLLVQPEVQHALELLTWHSFPNKAEWLKWWDINQYYPREDWLEEALLQREAVLKEVVALKKDLLNIRLESAKKVKAVDTEIALLTVALDDKYAALRQYALEQLNDYPEDKVKPLLPKIMDKLQDSSNEVRNGAVLLLGDVGDETVTERLAVLLVEYGTSTVLRKNIIISLSRLGGVKSVAAILDLLKQETKPDLCLESIRALGRLKAKEGVSGLIGYLTQEPVIRDTHFLCAVIDALGEIKDPRSIGPIIKFIDHTDDRVRWSVANCLGKLGDSQAAELLVKLLQDEFADIRQVTAEALGNIGDMQSVSELTKTMLNDQDTRVRELAARALGKIKDETALNSLLGALGDADVKVRDTAWNAIVVIIGEDINFMEEMADKLYETNQLTYAAELYGKLVEHTDLKLPEFEDRLVSAKGKFGIILISLQRYKEAVTYLEDAMIKMLDQELKIEIGFKLIEAYIGVQDYKKPLDIANQLLILEMITVEQKEWLAKVKSECAAALAQPEKE